MQRVSHLLVILLSLSPFLNVHATDDIEVTNSWINEAPPTVTIMAGYATVANHTDKDVELIAVNSPAFESIEMHNTVINDGVASMVKQETLNLQKQSTLEFKPGGLHLMLFNPVSPLKSGDTIALTFTFSDNTIVETKTEIRRKTADKHQHKHQHKHEHKHQHGHKNKQHEHE